nr:uncharacterized protein LOC109169218 [Ipomoea batatas]
METPRICFFLRRHDIKLDTNPPEQPRASKGVKRGFPNVSPQSMDSQASTESSNNAILALRELQCDTLCPCGADAPNTLVNLKVVDAAVPSAATAVEVFIVACKYNAALLRKIAPSASLHVPSTSRSASQGFELVLESIRVLNCSYRFIHSFKKCSRISRVRPDRMLHRHISRDLPIHKLISTKVHIAVKFSNDSTSTYKLAMNTGVYDSLLQYFGLGAKTRRHRCSGSLWNRGWESAGRAHHPRWLMDANAITMVLDDGNCDTPTLQL